MALPQILGTAEDDINLGAGEASAIFGRSGNDSITGSRYADVLFGGETTWGPGPGPGHYLEGVYRNIGDDDTIKAGDGNDIINAGAGADSIDGGAGIDQLDFYHDSISISYTIRHVEGEARYVPHVTSLYNVAIDLKAGTYSGDYLASDGTFYGHNSGGFKSIEAILGSAHNDIIRGSDHNDQFKPISGDDVIDGRKGFDVLSYNDAGTEGIVVNYASGKVRDSFGDTDTFKNISQIIGTAHNDAFNGAAGQQIFTGGNGKDTFNGGGGVDIVDYHLETGSKGINIQLGNGTGQDSYGKIDEFDSIEDIRGTIHADVINGNGLANEFWGDDGNDKIGGGGHNDTLHGSDGKDELRGGDGNDKLYGEAARDFLSGGDGNDTLDGGDDNDTLEGNKGDDRIDGGDGNDTILDKDATLSDDSKDYSGNTINGGDGNDTMTGFGVVSGGAGADTITGEGRLRGDAGDDHITALLMQAVHAHQKLTEMSGGAGNDTLEAGGANVITAQASYDYAGVGIKAYLGTGEVFVSATDHDTLIDVTGLTGSRLDDLIVGSVAAEYLTGGRGDDTIKAAGGADIIGGMDGNDILYGGSNPDNTKDKLYGGAGNDTLQGDGGSDVLFGEAGDDVFYIKDYDEADGGDGNDTFNVVSAASDIYSGDLIGGAGADTLVAGSHADVYFKGGAGRDLVIVHKDASVVAMADFRSGTDKIDLSAFGISSFSALMAKGKAETNENGSKWLEFKLDADTELRLDSLTKASLHTGDFIL